MLSRSDLCLSKLMNKHYTFDNKNQYNNVITIYKNLAIEANWHPDLKSDHIRLTCTAHSDGHCQLNVAQLGYG